MLVGVQGKLDATSSTDTPKKNNGGQGKLFCDVRLPCRDTINRLPQTGDNRRISLKQQLERKLIEYKKYSTDTGKTRHKSAIGGGSPRWQQKGL